MKKLLTIFALLCVSVAGFAIDWSGYEWLGDGAGGGAYSNKYKVAPAEGQSVVNIQQPGFANAPGIYTSFPAGVSDCSLGAGNYAIQGAGIILYVSAFTAQETEVTVTHGTGTAVFTVYYADGTTGGGGGDPDPGSGGDDPDPEPARASECFGAKGHFGNPSAKHVYYQIDYEDSKAIINLRSLTGYNLDFAEVHIFGVGNYAMTSNGAGGYSYTINNPTVDAEWYLRFLYSDTNMPGNEMTAENVNSSDPNIIYYVVGSCTSTVTENENIALSSAGSSATASTGNGSLAIDGTIGGGSRWESASEDPQWICVNFGERKKFNMVQLVHEGAYIKTYDIQVSDDGANFTTIKHVSETLDGFPYEQSIDLGFDYAAQYLRIYGTERGTGYGYSLWELRAMYSGASTLTSITLTTADNKTLVGGAGVVLTATPKDQKGNPMEETVSYEITPAAAGHMDGNTFIPDQAGMASIVAFNGAIRSAAVQVLGVTSANLALSTNIVTDNKIIAQSEFTPNGTDAFSAVDGNMSSVWQGSPTNGNVDDSREYDCWFVVDLGAFYNIDLVALHFEGACSELYHIDFSENNSDWNIGYNLVGAEGINARNDYWTDLDNNTKVRYVRFWSTKAATGWGMKMYEFEVYGTEWTSGDEEAPVMVSASLVSSTVNSAVIAVSATDNEEVARYHVVDATNEIDANFTPSEGKITITGLTQATDYNFTITAKDASGNESENSIVVAVSTPFDSSINLALNQPSEGGYYDNNPAESADKANDGNNSTSWVTYGDHAAALDWWIVDLGQIYNLTNITALWANDAYATSYILQTRIEAPSADDKADDAAWVTLATVSGVTAGEEKSTNVSGIGRYVRFRATSFAGGFFRLREFRVYASGVAEVDTEAPVMSSASLVSNTDSRAIIAVAATDNQGIANYHVVDNGNSIDANFVAIEGQIAVTGLTGGTNYTLVITAVDYFGNESANSKSVAVKTVAHLSEPQAVCPAPTWDATLVKAMYSPTYGADYTHQDWGGGTVATKDEFGRKYVTNGNGYFGADGFSLNCLMMEKLHYDIWIADDATVRFVPIWGGAEQGVSKNLIGQQWNSIDIDLTEYTSITNWGNIYQMKIDQAPNLTFWVANAYFYREAAIVDNEAPTNVSATVATAGFYSAQISVQASDNSGAVNFSVKNGLTELATGSAASDVATTITVNGLTPGTSYNLSVIASDESGNEAAPKALSVRMNALPVPAPMPVDRAEDVKSLYSNAYTPAVTLTDKNQNWYHAPRMTELTLGGDDNALLYDNLPNPSTFGWNFTSLDAAGFQKLHVSIYPVKSGTIEFYPVIAPENEYHRVSQTLEANKWNDVVIDYSDKSFAAFTQLGFTNYSNLGAFLIDNVYFSRPVVKSNVDKWATFAASAAIKVPSGVTVYKAVHEVLGNEEVLRLTKIVSGVIPANTGALLQCETESATYAFTLATSDEADVAAGEFEGNSLVGCAVKTDISDRAATHDIYALRHSDAYGFSGFFLYSGTIVNAGKAYLPIEKDPATPASSRRLRFVYDTATDVENVQPAASGVQKVLKDGQLYILRDEVTYTIQGVRVE